MRQQGAIRPSVGRARTAAMVSKLFLLIGPSASPKSVTREEAEIMNWTSYIYAPTTATTSDNRKYTIAESTNQQADWHVTLSAHGKPTLTAHTVGDIRGTIALTEVWDRYPVDEIPDGLVPTKWSAPEVNR
jgi:hypothetical protein